MSKHLLLFLIAFVAINSIAQEARFPIRNFGPKDYGTSHNSENWSIIQDKQGMILSGNYGGILKFDGNSWEFTEIIKDAWITSLAVNDNGTIFTGSTGDFGILSPDERGKYKYTSLASSLNEKDKMFSTIWRIHCINNLTFFQSEEALFIYDGKKLKVLHPKTSYHLSFKSGNNLYIREREIGIKKWENNELKIVDESQEFTDYGIFSILEQNNTAIIITQEKGIYAGGFSDKLKSLESLNDQKKDIFIRSKINGALWLKDGNIALYTTFSGLFVINTKGNILHHINKNSGLRDNDIKSAFVDKRGRIWLALNNGISCIDYPSTLYKYSYEEGITGNVTSITSYNDSLYVGTTDGLYKSSTISNKKPFEHIKYVSGQVRSLKVLNNILFIGTEESLYSFNGKTYKKEANVKSFSLAIDSTNKILYCVGNDGINSFKVDKEIHRLKTYPFDALFIGSDINPANNVLWVGTQNKGTAKLIDDTLRFYSYENNDGLVPGWVFPTTYNNDILFLTNRGLFSFIDEAIIKASLPEDLQKDPLNYRGYFEPAGFTNIPPDTPVYAFHEIPDGFYFSHDNIVTRYNSVNQTLYNTPFLGISMGKNNYIFPKNNKIWLGFDDGLICFDENKKSNLTDSISCIIRKVFVKDSLVYNGAGYLNTIGSDYFSQSVNNIPEFLYENNSLNFEFSSDYLDNCEYSYRLLPLDTAWSKWSTYPKASFNFLHEGDYTLEVKAKTIYGACSEITHWKFTILTPWYRTILAYLIYIILGIILIIVIVRLNSRRLRQQNIKLEKIVDERTAEIREKNSILEVQKEEIESQRDELGKQNVEILHQKKEITDSIEYALRIQNAAIPAIENIHNYLKDFFVFYRPKDIVSGDFYWIGTLENKPIVIAADCTGHGVPGAFMSMLGIAFLNEIINKERIGSPAEILNRLRFNIIKSLKQKSEEVSTTKDGMDITIISIDYDKNELTFAGANNSIYLIQENNQKEIENDSRILIQENKCLTELKPDKMPVAIYSFMEPFKENKISFHSGDKVYLFSDGYADQFGGPKGRKFMSKHMKELLISSSHLTMKEQMKEVEKAFLSWKEGFEQIDDVLVIGVEL